MNINTGHGSNYRINLNKESRLTDNAIRLAEIMKTVDGLKEEIVDLKEIVMSDLPEDFEEHKISISVDTDLVIKTPEKYDWDKDRLAEIVGSADLEQYSDVVTKSLTIAKRDFDRAEPEVRAVLSEALTIKRGTTTFKVTNNG